jgi:hypothetical protein
MASVTCFLSFEEASGKQNKIAKGMKVKGGLPGKWKGRAKEMGG